MRYTSIEQLAERASPSEGPACWGWSKAKDRDGYGGVWHDGKRHQAHRLAYELAHGAVPEDMTVDHTCFNRACINPEHLRLLPRKENSANQRRAMRTRCANGHEYTAESLYRVSGRSGRYCRTCNREAAKRYRERKRNYL